MIGFVFKFH